MISDTVDYVMNSLPVREDFTMKLQELLDDIEEVCKTCDACHHSCAGFVMKGCIQSEMDCPDLVQQSLRK
jgi:hypothetical protein